MGDLYLYLTAVNTRKHYFYVQGGPKKQGHGLTTIILSNLNRFKNFFTGRFRGKFAVKWISEIPPHITHVATLPCETLMSAKQAVNDKLQGSVATQGIVGLLIIKLGEVY